MREEAVTKHILKWLMENHWAIVCFDFPQSGTGNLLHPNASTEKNRDSINPDIVAVKNGKCVFFENKDRFYYMDYLKQNELIRDNRYSDAISKLLANYDVDQIYYGIGLPCSKYDNRAVEAAHLVNFIAAVQESGTVEIVYPKNQDIFI